MTIKRVQEAAALRGIWFDGEKKWRNSMIGAAYEVYTPNGRGFFQADALRALYNEIMRYKPIENR